MNIKTALVCACIVAFSAVSHAEVSKEEAVMEAKVMVKQLATQLKGELQSAVKGAGFADAIGVCKVSAPQLADEISAAHDGAIRRVSLKLRNPENAPDKYENNILEQMDVDNAAGKLAPAYMDVVDDNNGEKSLRFLKPIVTKKVCLNCHGASDKLNSEAMEEIRANYPKDKATGHKIDDVRGAFSVVVPMK